MKSNLLLLIAASRVVSPLAESTVAKFMKRLIPTLMAVLATAAPAQVITTVKSYRDNITPSPPGYLVRGEDGTLYGLGNMLYRWQPDGSGFTILRQEGSFIGPLSISGSTLYGMASTFKVGKINTDGSGYTVFAEDILAGNLLRREQIAQSLSGYPRSPAVRQHALRLGLQDQHRWHRLYRTGGLPGMGRAFGLVPGFRGLR